MSASKEIIKPIMVLTLICLIISAALTVTYQFTKPVIDATDAAEANKALADVYPGVESSETYEGELPAGVSDIRVVNGGEGYVITASEKGYGGDIKIMAGVRGSKIIGIKVLAMSETSGIGSQVGEESFLSQFLGVEDANSVSSISGATVSSTAFKTATQRILDTAKSLAQNG